MDDSGDDARVRLALHRVDLDVADHPVARRLSLSVAAGETACLLGPSGCGKTTTLRAIAGFHPVSAGEIRMHGATVSAPGFMQPPESRGLGMVFQDHALFPHLSVADNVAFGLRRRRGMRRRDARAVAAQMLELVALEGMGERYPHELSGGQQQRVALARALAPAPDLVLLDEPFSSLDTELRDTLANRVDALLKARGTSALLVTHDQHEAFAMADRVGVMHQGQLLQWDTPFNLYHEPAERFVADFIGRGRFLRARVREGATLDTELGPISGHRARNWPPGTEVEVLVRPDDVLPDPDASLRAEVVKKAFTGAETLYTLRLPGGEEILSLFPSHHDHAIGDRVGIRIDAPHLVIFRREAAPGVPIEAMSP